MFFRPKFCSNCGEKIERAEWHLWSSGRFCDLCATEHRVTEYALPAFALLVLVGFVAVLASRPSDNQPLIADRTPQQKARSLAALEPRLEAAPKPAPAAASPQAEVPVQTAAKAPAIEKPVVAASAYICGAETKRGTPCSRRVKGNARCYQHVGMPAIAPAEKLKIG
jgi:hypothetical protein